MMLMDQILFGVLFLKAAIAFNFTCITSNEKILYFAYGSNLLAKRIHLLNPTAERVGIAKLKNYRLDFDIYSDRWHGCSSTIVRETGFVVWGAIWELEKNELNSLDRQEIGPAKNYYRTKIQVQQPNGCNVTCYVYVHSEVPKLLNIFNLPKSRRPSLTYMNIIIKGAKESNLPLWYQKYLSKISTNSYNGKIDFDLY